MFRPKFHITTKGFLQNSMLSFFNGEYHIFFLTPDNNKDKKANYHSWGHVRSKNLIHWKEDKIAIKPDKEYDKYGCWNGSVVVKDDIPYLFYTGINPESQCLAVGDKHFKNFEKYEQNPIIKNRPEELNITGFRDPYVWQDENKKWKMILGCGIHGFFGTHYSGGGILIYESDNLYSWEYKGVMFKKSLSEGGFYFETPNYCNLGELGILMVSPNAPVVYWLGKFKNNFFESKTSAKRLDYGDCFYAPSLLNDKSNNRIIMSGWISEASEDYKQKVFGSIALPKVISLKNNKVLNFYPVPELTNLRKEIIFDKKKIINSKKNNLNFSESNTFELKLNIIESNCDKIIFNFCKNLLFDEYTSIIIDIKNSNFELNRSKSSIRNGSDLSLIETKISSSEFKLHMYFDMSVIEIFLNYEKIITTKIYPNVDSKSFEIYSEGTDAKLDIKLWELDSYKIK